MTCKTGSATLLLSVLGVLAGAAASENSSGLAGNRGLPPIICVWFGDKNGTAQRNSLPSIRKVVDALGISVAPSDAHENHFHVDIRTPDRVEITPPPAQLLAGGDVNSETSMTGLNADDVARFVEQAQTELNIEQGETTVFTLDIPDVPQHYASVMVAQSNQAAAGKERAIGICHAVDHGSGIIGGRPRFPALT